MACLARRRHRARRCDHCQPAVCAYAGSCARRAQQLAATFGLSGRVDLYQAFLVAMAKQLRPGGLLGVITSNRFLTTKGGMATRRFLRKTFEVVEVIDLGDTKLFDAAVLPALVFAKKRGNTSTVANRSRPAFLRIYEAIGEQSDRVEVVQSVCDCLRKSRSGTFRVNGSTFRVTAGSLPLSEDDTRPWTMLTGSETDWVQMIDTASACRIGDVAKVRVGIKTTADSVFIRRDWESLPAEIRPVEAHLRPLLTQEDAARWRPIETCCRRKRVLYTHESVNGRRQVIRFDEASSTWQYLLANKERLESRKYVVEAGRDWHEIWVPQDPSAWLLPKIVFPDISLDAKFFLDRSGCVVNGNCYWITTNDPEDEDLLMLMLGIANSTLIGKYHDLAFQNKLYSQRRRHLTQYIAEYPLPPRHHPASRKISRLVRRLTSDELTTDSRQKLALEIDCLAAQAFGIDFTGIKDISG